MEGKQFYLKEGWKPIVILFGLLTRAFITHISKWGFVYLLKYLSKDYNG